MTLKSLVTAVVTGTAGAALVASAAAGVTSIASPTSSALEAPRAIAVAPVVFDIPMPLQTQSPLDLQLQGVLSALATPGVSFRAPSKLSRIEGGVGMVEGRAADRMLEKYLPLSFLVTDSVQSGNTATANVTASGPNLTSSKSQPITFVNTPGVGWQVSAASVSSVLTAVTG